MFAPSSRNEIRKLARQANMASKLYRNCETDDASYYHHQATKLSGRLKRVQRQRYDAED